MKYPLLEEALQLIQQQLAELEEKDNLPQQYEDYMIYVNAGHGGLHPDTGEYRTFKSDGKLYTFLDAEGEEVLTAHEGHTNRLIAEIFILMLAEAGIPYLRTYHPFEDRTNQERTAIANAHYSSKKPLGLWMSFHSNAYGMAAQGPSLSPQGFSLFSSRGFTVADLVADVWFVEHQKLAGDQIKYRLDRSDGDKDFEVDFNELIWTKMPAVLCENLFFTNLQDAKLLYSPEYQELSAQAAFNTVLKIIESDILRPSLKF